MYEEQKNPMMNDVSESSWSRHLESDPSLSAAAAAAATAAAAPPLRQGPSSSSSSSSAAWFVPHTNAMGTATAGITHYVGTQPPEDRGGGSTIVNGKDDSLLLLHSSFPSKNSNSNSNTRNAPPPPPPTRTVCTHINSTFDKVPLPPPPMAKESQAQAHSQAQAQSQAQESWNTHTSSPSPSSNHNTNLCGGFDPANLAWLQRMEEVATVWLNMLVQNQHHHHHPPPPAYQPHTMPHNDYTAHHNKLRSIMDFCTRTLQQILSEGGFRGYTTPSYSPSLYNQPLPSLQDLPCMVVTLKYWYSALLSRCQHQTAIAMLPQRIFTAQHLAGISVPDHVRSCEKDVRQWLGVVIPPSTPAAAAATTTTTTTAQPVQRGSPAHAAVWVQQLQTKSVPAYSPVKPKPTTSRSNNNNYHNRRSVTTTQPPPMQVPQKKRAKEGRMTSPTDVMMLDAMMVATLEATAAPPQPSQGVVSEISPEVVFMNSHNTTSCHSPIEEEDQKPAAKFSAAPPRTTSMGNVVQHPSARGCIIVTGGQESHHGATLTSPLSPPTCSSPTTNINTKEQEHRMRGLILSLYHACKCPYTSSTGQRCPIYKNCRLLKALWHHISAETKSSCCSSSTSSYCAQFGDLCPEAESALRHYGRCKSEQCSVCGPVLQYLPKIKQDILNVTMATRHHQAAAVEEAILQVVDELSDALMLPGATTTTSTISVPEGTSTKMNPPDGWTTTTQPYHVTGLSETKDPSSSMLLLLQPPSPLMTMPPNASFFPTHVEAGPRTISATVPNRKKTHYQMFREDGDVHVPPQPPVARPLPLKKRCYSSTDSSSSSSSSSNHHNHHHGSDDHHHRPRHYDPPRGHNNNNNNDSHHNATTTIATTCIQSGIDSNQ
jgi:TAZ zinc finger